MYQILSPRVFICTAVWLSLAIFPIFELLGIPPTYKNIVTIVDVFVLFVLCSNPVWRLFWNRTGPIGRLLSDYIYPDLNGTYAVTLESNWPVVKQMLDAARKEAPPFDPFDIDQASPPPMIVKLEAKIKQSWFKIRMSMYSTAPGAIIDQSETLVMMPIRNSDTGEKNLVYVFRQKNSTRAATDDNSFEGAAYLTVDPENHDILTGEYWNNRGWQRGINAAGKIRLARHPRLKNGCADR